MSDKEHWEDIYNRKKYSEVTWFQAEPKMSLEIINGLNLNKDVSILDVGAGSSTLVDHLIQAGYTNINLLELSENAFVQSKERIGNDAQNVKWLVGDACDYDFQNTFDLWHDRAVFHFLTKDQDQKGYINNLNNSLEVDSYFIISTFAEDGPLKCSGLDIVRYSKDELVEKLGRNFSLIEFKKETHVSPGGMEQRFNYWVFKKIK